MVWPIRFCITMFIAFKGSVLILSDFGNRVIATSCFAFVSCVLVVFHLVFHVWLFLSFCVLLVMTYIASSPLGDIGKHRFGYVKLSSMIDIFTIDQIRYNNYEI